MRWNLALGVAVGATALLSWLAGAIDPDATLAGLAGVAIAGLACAALADMSGDAAALIGIGLWVWAGAGAALATGGSSGPLAAWCLAPVAVGAAFGHPKTLAFGAGGGILAVGAAALASATLDLPRPTEAQSVWLNLLSLGTIAVGFSAALIALQGRIKGEEQRRNAHEALLRERLDRQPQLLLALTPNGQILDSFGEAPKGLDVRDLPGDTILRLAAVEDQDEISRALSGARAEGFALVAFHPAHDPEGWWEVILQTLDGGRLAAAVRDAGAQKAREADLIAAREQAEEQNAGKSRFLANMSHELRTPLNAILGFSDIMRQRLFGPLSDRYSEYAELIHESGSHLLELINDVLDMSKIEADKFELAREDFDARDAVDGVLRLMRGQADRAGITLRGRLAPEPLMVDADRRALKQIALNLISNALKFTPRGGSVDVAVHSVGAVLEMTVADTGVGISREDLARLGRPFEQAGDSEQRQRGSGLGLSIARAFTRLHSGELTIESTPGVGTTVTVRMPVLVGADIRKTAKA